MGFRRGPDGELFVPVRGKPPAAPDGYEPDPNDPYRFQLKILDCKHRDIKIKKEGCCEQVIKLCTVVNRPVTRRLCNQCGADPSWIKQKFGSLEKGQA